MSARSGLAGKRIPRPHLGPSGLNFRVGRKKSKNAKILPIFLGGPLLLSTLGGAIGIPTLLYKDMAASVGVIPQR